MRNPYKSKRKLRNVKLTKQYHTRYLGLWVFVCTLQVLVIAVIIYAQYSALWQNVAANVDLSLEVVYQQYYTFAVLSIEVFLFITAIVALAIMTAHRIAGPFLGLKRTFNAIIDGNIDTRLQFRKTDDLDDISELFNKMMDTIRERLDNAGATDASGQQNPAEKPETELVAGK